MAAKLAERTLKKYEDQLLDLRARLRGEVEDMVQGVPETAHHSGMESHVPTHIADQDSEGLDAELAIIHNEEDMLQAVEDALECIDQGTFGQCTNCGNDIGKERLDALPYTPFCIRCAEEQAQG